MEINMNVIQVEGAGFGYDEKYIFKNINLEVKKGEVLCLIGPNGCGKTTFLDCLLGILKLKKGQVLINGENMKNYKANEIARHIAYVPQFHGTTFPYTVLEVVTMGRAAYTSWFNLPSKEDYEIAEKALEMVGISKFKDKSYTELSGGEVQLVMIARAIAQNSSTIVMDEPAAHLDFRHELIVLENIVQLAKKKGKSIVMATHFPNHAFYFENNKIDTFVALMSNGKLIAYGRPTEVLNEDNLEELYKIKSKIISCDFGPNIKMKQIVPIQSS